MIFATGKPITDEHGVGEVVIKSRFKYGEGNIKNTILIRSYNGKFISLTIPMDLESILKGRYRHEALRACIKFDYK